MDTIKAIIVDDENHCVHTLRYELSKHCPHVEVIGVALSGEEAIDKINDLHPDLVFMDIEMPGMSGFDVLHRLSPVTFNIIFVTAYDQYAIQAFRYAALDYLLKPVTWEQLKEAVSRVGSYHPIAEDSASFQQGYGLCQYRRHPLLLIRKQLYASQYAGWKEIHLR